MNTAAVRAAHLSVAFFAVAGLLTACAARPPLNPEESAFYSVKAGSKLVLHRALTIPSGQVAVYLQNGEVMPARDVNQYYPNCKFEVYTISESPRTVEPDTFVIYRIVDEMQEVSAGRPMYAANGGFAMLVMSDGPIWYNFTTQMYLQSGRQPDVYRMTCRHLEELWKSRYLSIRQMRDAMGKVLTLESDNP